MKQIEILKTKKVLDKNKYKILIFFYTSLRIVLSSHLLETSAVNPMEHQLLCLTDHQDALVT